MAPSILEKTLLDVAVWCGATYRVFLFGLAIFIWIVNIIAAYHYPIRRDVQCVFVAVVMNGLVYSAVHIYIEYHARNDFNLLTTLSMCIYVVRMYYYNRFATEAAKKETVLPQIPKNLRFITMLPRNHLGSESVILWAGFNFFLRVCFTCGFFTELHPLFNSIAMTSICCITITRQFCTFMSASDSRTWRAVLPCFLHVFSMFLAFGKEIIPEREFCETVLLYSLITSSYLSEPKSPLEKPLSEPHVSQAAPARNAESQRDPELVESARRTTPAYQRKITVKRLYYLLHGHDALSPEPISMRVQEGRLPHIKGK